MSNAAGNAAVAVKKSGAASKAKKPADHPKYAAMIKDALTALKERGGSSRQAILKYISSHNKLGAQDEKSVNAHLKMALRAGVKNGSLKQSKGTGATGSFRIGDAVKQSKPAKKTKAAGAKKPKVAKKPKTASSAAKKTKSPKKTAAGKVKKPKTAKKPKSATKTAKPKSATKPKTSSAAKPKKAKTTKAKPAKKVAAKK